MSCTAAIILLVLLAARPRDPERLPPLYDVTLPAMSPQAFTLTVFERIDGTDYAQSWLVTQAEQTDFAEADTTNPAGAGAVLARNQLLLAAREAESGKAKAEKRQRTGFRNICRERGHRPRKSSIANERQARSKRHWIVWIKAGASLDGHAMRR